MTTMLVPHARQGSGALRLATRTPAVRGADRRRRRRPLHATFANTFFKVSKSKGFGSRGASTYFSGMLFSP